MKSPLTPHGIIAVFAILLTVFPVSSQGSEKQPKSQMVATTLKAINEIYILSKKNVISEGDYHREQKVDVLIKPVIDALHSEEELLQTAGLAYVISSPQEAGDERFDIYFDRAFWLCANRLAENRSKTAGLALSLLRQDFANDGDLAEGMDNLIRKQKIIQEK